MADKTSRTSGGIPFALIALGLTLVGGWWVYLAIPAALISSKLLAGRTDG